MEKFIAAIEACPYIQGKQKIKVRDWLGNYIKEIPSSSPLPGTPLLRESTEIDPIGTSFNRTSLLEEDPEDYKYVTKKEFKFEINRIWNTLRG